MADEKIIFREFDEDDEMAFGKYEPDAKISEDILVFTIKGIQYISRVIISRFKVIIEAVEHMTTEADIRNSNDIESKLDTNITLECEVMAKSFTITLGDHLFKTDAQITGEDLLIWGFKIL